MENKAEYKVKDNGDTRKYYTQVPNIVDDLIMSVYAFRLYVHLKRVASDDGTCWQSTRTLAAHCNMSLGSVTKAKEELKSLSLITIELVKDKKGEHHEIKIVDIWPENMKRYACSCGEHPCSCGERTCSPGEPKNNPNKNNHRKKEEEENIFLLYESSIGPLTGSTGEELKSLEADYPSMWIEDAFAIAKNNKATHLKYVTAILTRWNKNGKDNGFKKKKGVDLSAFDKVREEMERDKS